jgi:NADH:ubiquinone oxidoreductase subunit 6 (subunit J)
MPVPTLIAMFVLSLWISSYLWHAGARTIAGLPLMVYTGAVTLYSMWTRFHRHP